MRAEIAQNLQLVEPSGSDTCNSCRMHLRFAQPRLVTTIGENGQRLVETEWRAAHFFDERQIECAALWLDDGEEGPPFGSDGYSFYGDHFRVTFAREDKEALALDYWRQVGYADDDFNLFEALYYLQAGNPSFDSHTTPKDQPELEYRAAEWSKIEQFFSQDELEEVREIQEEMDMLGCQLGDIIYRPGRDCDTPA
ncbi:MAG: hypothetical protein ACLPZY_08895 [Terracidiphilus sp.]